jgi:hypothetical protein
MPNCRAICDGLMPALSAARTALTCPRFNETFATSACVNDFVNGFAENLRDWMQE